MFCFFGHIKNVFHGALDIALGVLDGSTGIFDGNNNAVFWSGDGLLGNDGVGLHGLGTGASVRLAVRRLEKIVAFPAQHLIGCETCYPGTCRIHKGDGEIFVDLHNGGGDDIHVRGHLAQVCFSFLETGDVV